jgi:hypothetical protein
MRCQRILVFLATVVQNPVAVGNLLRQRENVSDDRQIQRGDDADRRPKGSIHLRPPQLSVEDVDGLQQEFAFEARREA